MQTLARVCMCLRTRHLAKEPDCVGRNLIVSFSRRRRLDSVVASWPPPLVRGPRTAPLTSPLLQRDINPVAHTPAGFPAPSIAVPPESQTNSYGGFVWYLRWDDTVRVIPSASVSVT